MSYPTEVSDDEPIVRVAKNPYHLNKSRTKLTPAAFKAPNGCREVSVIRWRYTFSDSARLKAIVKEIGGQAYAGIAHLTADDCRRSGVEVVDSREQFRGHADLLFAEADPPHEPLEGDIADQSAAIRRKLADVSEYLADPEPNQGFWTISDFPPPAVGP